MRALQFIAMIEDMRFLNLLSAGERELKSATALLRKFADEELTRVDAMGLSVIATRRIRSCWSTDFHLRLTGVPLVIHEH